MPHVAPSTKMGGALRAFDLLAQFAMSSYGLSQIPEASLGSIFAAKSESDYLISSSASKGIQHRPSVVIPLYFNMLC